MVKKPDTEGQADTVQPEPKDDIAVARRAVQDILGCGIPEAEARLKKMSAKKVSEIAELERAGKRPKIVAILYS